MKNKISGRDVYNNFQRIGFASNSQVGNDFEEVGKLFFARQGIELVRNYRLEIGVNENKKIHVFDLGDETSKVIVECKSHRWTMTEKTPSAKMTVWNEAMFYFYIAPKEYRKILFVLRSIHSTKKFTLAEYYLRRYPHLIATDVEIWEYDEEKETAERIN